MLKENGWRGLIAVAVLWTSIALSAFDQTTPRKSYHSLLLAFKPVDVAGYSSY